MDGKLKIIVLIFLFWSCENKKKDDIIIKGTSCQKEGKEFIYNNINFLIDSVETFDMTKISAHGKYKDVKKEKFKIGVLDSIVIEENKEIGFLKFKIDVNDLSNFKSEYKIAIVKLNNYDTNILFIQFSDFIINDAYASIIVKKIIGISMIKSRYYFKKENNKWILEKKELLSLG